MKPEEIETKLKEFQTTIDAQKKDFDSKLEVAKKDYELKLESEKRETESWKENARKREEENKKFQEQAEKSSKEAAAALAKAREQETKAFIEKLKREGRITPAVEGEVLELMGSMTSDATVAAFKEKDGSTRNHTQLSLFKKLLESLPVRMSYAQHTYGEVPSAATPDQDAGEAEEHFMEVITKSGKQTLPVKGQDVHEKAEKYMEEMRAKGRTVSYADALIAVTPKKVSA